MVSSAGGLPPELLENFVVLPPLMNFRTALKLPLLAALIALFVVPQLASAATTTATTATNSIKWNKPVQVENPWNGAAGLDAVSCPLDGTTTELCVVADDTGHVWISTKPTNNHDWHKEKIDTVSGASLTGVSCPTSTLCVAVDNQGDVMSTTRPGAGAKYWSKPLRIDPTAADGSTTAIDGYSGIAAISCPTATLCVAVDNSGQVITSTDPTGAASAWTVTAITGAPVLTSVSCYSAALCVLGGSQRYVSTTPTGGATAWTAHGAIATGSTISAIDCEALTLCVAVGFGDSSTALASGSSTPTGNATAWVPSVVNSSIPSGNAQLLDAVACPLIGLCVALDGADNVYETTTPVNGKWTTVTSPRTASVSTWSAIACDSKICTFVDSRGWIGTGTVHHATAS